MKTNLFQSLQEDLSLVLLFLNKVKKIKIEVISENGSVKYAEVDRRVEDLSAGLKRIHITDDLTSEEEVFLTTQSHVGAPTCFKKMKLPPRSGFASTNLLV